MHPWQTSRRTLGLDRTFVMAILNITPDSFSDGGQYLSVAEALERAETMIAEGADLIDIGGESTRPGSVRVASHDEIERIRPAVTAIRERFDIPISVDTSKAEVAEAALQAGAEIINDISGLRFDERIAEVVARNKAGLVLMHSRGEFESMHSQTPVENIMEDVAADFRRSIDAADKYGIAHEQIVLDVGIGFGKTLDQNLELIAKIDKLAAEFPSYALLVGASRKSFIGKLLGDGGASERLSGSLAAAAVAAWNGARIVRVHDVKETVECLKIVDAARASLNR
jgi:dihydropteroate synthase